MGQTHDSLQTLLADVNATATSIADLNQAIKRADAGAACRATSSQDKRDVLVLHLSEQVGATSTVDVGDGTLNVVVGGTTLVAGNSALGAEAHRRHTTSTVDGEHAAGDPDHARRHAGARRRHRRRAQLTAMTSIIPGYQDAAGRRSPSSWPTQVNAGHQTGYDQDGKPGEPMFDRRLGGDTAVTAANITLALTSTRQIAAATLDPARPAARAAGGTWTVVSSDNNNADTMFQQRLSTTGADATYRKMIVGARRAGQPPTSSNLATQSVISTQGRRLPRVGRPGSTSTRR